MKICEKCGKEHDGSFGSGRFCSRSCANSHDMTEVRRKNISKGLLKPLKCNCQFCGDEFNNLLSKSQHERHCKFNPNKETVNLGAISNHNKKLDRKVRIDNYETHKSVELDITYGELELYRQKHKVCEICGKSIDNLSLETSKVKYKNLSIDHDHRNNHFRGLLCNTCNRELGWYENNQQAIQNYLTKN